MSYIVTTHTLTDNEAPPRAHILLEIGEGNEITGKVDHIVTLDLSPREARRHAQSLIEMAYLAEMSAHLTTAMREQKIPEDRIQMVIASLRKRVGRY